MSLVFCAISPHPPVLIPAVGKENLKQLKKTAKAFALLEEELYGSQPETIIIISPHGPLQSEAFTMDLNSEFTADFSDFGDFDTSLTFKGDLGLAYLIREKLETKAPLQLTSENKLDHGTAVPLYFLTRHLPEIKIIPLYYSGLDREQHFYFGQLLNKEIARSKTRVAVIASGDLSHRLTLDAPAGYSPKGKKFDQKLIKLLEGKETEEILKIDHALTAEAGECGLKSIIILLGILSGVNCQPQLLSYEAPFGVGYLIMNFKL